MTGTAKPFSDCDDADVLALAGCGVIGGYEDQTFRPANTLNRAEISKIICLLMKEATKRNHTAKPEQKDRARESPGRGFSETG